MTIPQAAAWLHDQGVDLQPDTIKQHCQSGKIKAEKHGRDWWISDAALTHFIARRATPPAPAPDAAPTEERHDHE